MDLPFTTEDLARLYRFTLLLTGEDGTAQQVLHDACAGSAARLRGIRNEEGRMACMIGALREKAKLVTAVDGKGIGKSFAALPEEERVTLAGLYSGLLPARALAEALKLPLDRMGSVLKHAREKLPATSVELTREPAL